MNDGIVTDGDVAYVYANDNGRNLNRKQLDNQWNQSCRFLRVRQSLWLSAPIRLTGWERLFNFNPLSTLFPTPKPSTSHSS